MRVAVRMMCQKQWLGFAHRFRPTYRGAPVLASSPVEPEVTDPDLDYAMDQNVKIRGIPHLAKNERDMGHPPIRGRDESHGGASHSRRM
jgi:hypothetical protein